ncbi:MAG: response regulator [Pseudomonadota bacterium]
MRNNLSGKRVLVVEDNYILAMELADELEAANAVVVGPCSNLSDASLQVAHSDLAVLDVNLSGQNTFHLADRLQALDVPYVFFTGYDKEVLPERFAGVDCITKPLPPSTVVRQLDIRSREIDSGNIIDLIPMLRARARSFLADPQAADRLVEMTLQSAIDDPAPMPSGAAVAPWLIHLMDDLMQYGSRHFMN